MSMAEMNTLPSSSMSIFALQLAQNLLNDLAALADDVADLIHIDLHGQHLGRVLESPRAARR